MKNILALIILSLMTCAAMHAQSYKVIVNTANNTSSISTSELSDIFLKKQDKWSNGDYVIPVDQSAKIDVRKDFSTEIIGKSASAVKSYWQQYVFAGKGTPPVEKGTDTEVIDFVKNNPGAIGYISASTATDGVKVITIN